MQRLTQLSTLQIALIASIAVHAALLMVRIVDPQGFNRILDDTPLEVVLVNASSADRPTKAQVIAQRNLAGGGDAADARATSPLPPAPLAEVGNAVDDARRQIEQMQEQQLQMLAMLRRELASLPPPPDPKRGDAKPAPQADEERRRQLLQLLAQIEKRINEENSRPRRRFVSPAAREGVHAIYYDSLRHRIEDLGTHNFPELNGRKLYGELTMLVAVDALGRVVQTEVVKTSGNKLLDKRAVSIVRGASPYGGFTPAMRAQFDQLVFVSRFRFTRNEGLRATVEDAGPR
jgi:protein TonB